LVKNSDVELAVAAQRDPAAFVALYDRYFPRVNGYVRLRVRDGVICEDVTSQVFTTALEKIDTFRGRGSFSAWLFRIAHNAIYNIYRRREISRSGDLP
jgi:RNA polymerase sigma-70 factor (ECF subfamily)